MPSFTGNHTQVVTAAEENMEVQLCPKCTFPNYPAARACTDCGYPLAGSNIRWIRAALVRKCSAPDCGAFGSVRDRVCRRCRQAPEQTAVQPLPAAVPPAIPAAAEYILLCPQCRHSNHTSLSACAACGYPLDDVDPVSAAQAVQPSGYTVLFENIRTYQKTTMELEDGKEITIGRSACLAEQMEAASFVSSEHLTLVCRNGQLWIRDHSRNGTYINGTGLPKAQEVPLVSGTVVGLGDRSASTLKAAFFRITY